MTIETEREADGRFITEIPELPGDMVYGTTEAEACAKAIALARRFIADRIAHGESVPPIFHQLDGRADRTANVSGAIAAPCCAPMIRQGSLRRRAE